MNTTAMIAGQADPIAELTHFRQPLLPTPFEPRTAALNVRHAWAAWAGYRVPKLYRDAGVEYFAIRNQVGVYDISPMVKYRITGADAEAYLNRLTLRDVARQKPGRVVYTAWCDGAGKVIDDGTLFRYGENEFRLCCQERHWPWLQDNALGFDVEIAEVTQSIAGLSLQGPTSFSVLKAAGLEAARKLKPFDLATFELPGGVAVEISRTGFTADLGYELWMESGDALAVWDHLFSHGRQHGLQPFGNDSLDIARVEAGFIMTGADFISAHQALRLDRTRSPYEIGLGWMVDFAKGGDAGLHFNGRRALMEEKEKGLSQYCLVGLEIEGNVPAEHSLVYHRKTKEVGHLTAAIWSPTLKRNIGIASLKKPYGFTVSDELWVEVYAMRELAWHKLMLRARIVERPFFNPSRRRATPPGLV